MTLLMPSWTGPGDCGDKALTQNVSSLLVKLPVLTLRTSDRNI